MAPASGFWSHVPFPLLLHPLPVASFYYQLCVTSSSQLASQLYHIYNQFPVLKSVCNPKVVSIFQNHDLAVSFEGDGEGGCMEENGSGCEEAVCGFQLGLTLVMKPQPSTLRKSTASSSPNRRQPQALSLSQTVRGALY